VNNIKEARNYIVRPIPQADVGFDNPFCESIQQHHARRQNERKKAPSLVTRHQQPSSTLCQR
jgi:hypothetical protein